MSALERSRRVAGGLAVLVLAVGCAGPQSAEPLRDDPAPAATGPVTVQPQGPGATVYSAGPQDRADSALAQTIRSRIGGIEVSACLERAAEQYVKMPAAEAKRLPLAATEFLVHWAGCADATAAVVVIETDETSDEPVIQQVEKVLPGSGYTHVGAASAEDGADYARRWILLLAQRSFELKPVPREVPTGGDAHLQFKLDGALRDPRVICTMPGGGTQRTSAGSSAAWGVAAVPVSSRSGRQWAELVATGRRGPEVVALFPLWVGRPAPAFWRGDLLPDDSGITTPGQAESFIAQLVNDERRRFGLTQLPIDATLAEAAREHSRDMAENHYFGHVSPTRGGLDKRLHAAGYAARDAAENVAEAGSLVDLHQSLMRSPGHRANILASDVTQMGIGAVRGTGPDGEPTWVVTEEFAQPLKKDSASALKKAIQERIGESRRRRGVGAVRWEAPLDRAAAAAAEKVAADGYRRGVAVDAVKQELESRGVRFKSLAVATGQAFVPGDISLPKGTADPDVEAAGVGVADGGDPGTPATYVVVLARGGG